MQGYIKLYRKIRENPIFNNMELFRLWMICLTEATHRERDQIVGKQTVHLMPGEFVTGRFDLHAMYNLGLSGDQQKSPKTVWRWLETLEKGEFLTINSTNKYSVVSILNWHKYQIIDQQNDQQVTNKRPTNDQQVTTNNNVNNDLNVLNDITTTDDGFEKVFRAYCDIHEKAEHHATNQIHDIEKVLNKGIPAETIISVMTEKHEEKKKKGEKVYSFSYYHDAIIQTWEGRKKLEEHKGRAQELQSRGTATTSPEASITGGKLGWLRKDKVIQMPNVQGRDGIPS